MQSANEQTGQLLIDFNIIIKQLEKIKEAHLPKPVLLRHVWPDIGIFTQPATIIVSLACPPTCQGQTQGHRSIYAQEITSSIVESNRDTRALQGAP